MLLHPGFYDTGQIYTMVSDYRTNNCCFNNGEITKQATVASTMMRDNQTRNNCFFNGVITKQVIIATTKMKDRLPNKQLLLLQWWEITKQGLATSTMIRDYQTRYCWLSNKELWHLQWWNTDQSLLSWWTITKKVIVHSTTVRDCQLL